MARALVIDAGPAMSIPLSEFPHAASPGRADMSSRVSAGLLTATLYVLFVLIAWWSSAHRSARPAMAEITATIVQDTPHKHADIPPPPFIARLVRPRAETAAPPVFTIASGAPPQAPAPLAASTALSSPMRGGTSGNGTMGQAASGNGTNGNGAGLAGCLDTVWMRAVTERVRQFFYYPGPALASRITGVVTMHFAVRRNGQIDKLAIGKSSGNDELDKAAYDILQKAQPLPPIPERMHVDRVDGDLPINFGVRSFTGGASQGNCTN